MPLKYFIKMLCVLVLCPVLLASIVAVQTLTIDSQLGTSVEDCFERISIGEQLPSDVIYRNVSELTTRECETICKQDKQCQTFDYGVGAKGNATCNLSTVSEKELKEKNILRRHPDYDVYMRRFQCEQSPPSPLQPQFDEGEGPAHRPIFRPDEDEPKRPLDDYLTDSRPFETIRPDLLKPIPPYRPPYNNYIDDRPDDYNQKPAYDRPPSYGAHKPQDIPYKPSRPERPIDSPPSYGLHKPQDIPYKPFNNQSQYKPDPFDVLHFQGPYRPTNPLNPNYWRPDPYHPPHLSDEIQDIYGPKPIRPTRPLQDPFGLEKPEYHYIIRPNRKPRPDDSGYGTKPDYHKPDPYQDTGHPGGPIGPFRPYDYPSRPSNKPSYSYNSQYASNYGQSQYQDNSIYLEIYDPPRPYKPRPIHDRPSYGTAQEYRPGQNYGSNYGYGQSSYDYGSQSHGSHLQSHSSSSYGQGTITEIGFDQNYNRPQDSGYSRPQKPDYRPQDSTYRPQKPLYGSQSSGYGTSSTGYGSQSSGYGSSSDSQGYGSQSQKPNDVTQKPSYGSSQASYGEIQASYGSVSHSDTSYGSNNRPSYGGTQDDNQGGYGLRPSKPTTQRPAFGSSQGYGDTQSLYGGQTSIDGGSYGSNQYGSFLEHHDSHYSSQQSSQSFGSYGSTRPPQSDRPSYSDNRPSYGGSRPPYSDSQSGYGNRPGLSDDRPYGDNRPSNNRPLYSDNRPYDRPSYGDSRPSYDRPSYGDAKPSYDNRPSYGLHTYGDTKPSYDRPSYGNSKPSYDRPSYGDTKPSYGDTKPSYDRPSYGNNKPSYDIPSYGGSKPSYESSQGGYGGSQPSYESDRPDPAYDGSQSTSDTSSGYGTEDYKNNRPTSPKPAYGSTSDHRPNQTEVRPSVKPVYEYELDKPSNVPSYIVRPGGEVVTSRPVTIGDYGGKPGQGREPYPASYKACFRRVLAGRRALRSFVRKVVPCERLEDCRRECAEERRFHCESFNYRLDPSFRGKGLCELMTKPIEHFDITRDFVDDKDYDFYELDRNSLEPHCPESLRGPGMLHSGFLSSKPDRLPGSQNQWTDRMDWQDTRYNSHNRWQDDRFYDDRRNGGRRRYEDYIPYQIGIARSNEADIENWGLYGGQYGGYDTYYKDKQDYLKSINHWRLPNEIQRTYGVRPGHDIHRHFDYHSLGKERGWEDAIPGHRYGLWKRGRWNSSGSWGGLDYGESKYYKPLKPHHFSHIERDDETPIKDCSSRRRPGMSLGSGAIRRSLLARNVVECEAACFEETEFKCVSYSYRYSNSRGTDNCFLSERPYRGLELSADSGSDVYAMPQDQGCSTINHKPWIESECFWHVRSEAAVHGAAVRAALTVTGLGACEAECIRAHAFFCRGFSFRHDSPTIGDEIENCILTSSPPTSLDAGHGLRSTVGHELYARGNYGRGCEPALYDDTHQKETQCYLQYDNAAKLIGSAVRGQARVLDEEACGTACTEAPFRCLSFSYNNNAPPGVDNCLLSEIRLFDLQRGVDYQHSVDDWLFAFDLFNGRCWRKVHGKSGYDEPTHEVPRPIIHVPDDPYPGSAPSGPSGYPSGPPAAEPYLPGTGPSGPGYKPDYSSGPGYHEPSGPEPSGPGFKPAYPPPEPSAPGYLPKPGYRPGYRPSEPSGPGYLPKPDYRPSEPSGPSYGPGFKPGFRPSHSPGYSDSGFKPGFPPPQPEHGYRPGDSRPHPDPPGPKPGYGDREDNEPIAVSWRHYTVSGFPCRAGTTCAQNQVAGHWACEPEGGEVGSWDYCCAPTHRCGYSEGFVTPWCYVGTNQDQWRPCSEKYYPYHQHNIPHPSQGQNSRDEHHHPPSRPYQERPPHRYDDRDRPPIGPYTSESERKYWDDLYKNGPRAYYDKYGNPLPGYTRVPTASRPYIKYRHNYGPPGPGTWVPVSGHDQDPHSAGGLGAPRYWPVAYLHKGPPPNMTYFTYNETKPTTTEAYPRSPIVPPRPQPPPDFNKVTEKPKDKDVVEGRNHRFEKTRNITNGDLFNIGVNPYTTTTTTTSTTTPKVEIKEDTVVEEKEIIKNITEVETIIPDNVKDVEKSENLKGIDDKLDDFTSPIEVLDIEDAKTTGEKMSDLKTLEAEERQIEAIGRLLASRRGSKLVLEKRSQKDLESKSIAVDKDLVDFNFGNRFPTTERRGIIQKVTKDEIERERNADKSLEVSETTFVRPPRVLSTTENVRKAIINGKIFYDATIREQRDIFSNATRKAKAIGNFRQLEDSRAPSVITNSNYGKKKVIKTRNVNPVRRVRRVYRKRYNPEEVRRRLLERDRSIKTDIDSSKKL